MSATGKDSFGVVNSDWFVTWQRECFDMLLAISPDLAYQFMDAPFVDDRRVHVQEAFLEALAEKDRTSDGEWSHAVFSSMTADIHAELRRLSEAENT